MNERGKINLSDTKNSIIIENFLNMLRESEGTTLSSHSLMEDENKRTQDYLHKLELDNLNYKERAKLSTKLMENRRLRRKYKDEYEENLPISAFVDANKQFVKKLEQLLGEIRKVEKYHENRQYYPRIDK